MMLKVSVHLTGHQLVVTGSDRMNTEIPGEPVNQLKDGSIDGYQLNLYFPVELERIRNTIKHNHQ